MASRITLPFWPTSLDCLDWSSDNIIAVGGGEQIGILTPRLHGTGPNGTHWNSTVFKANAFTLAEVPLLQPLTFENFSPGEELSLRHVHALEWSPPGLGRFRHCVLAVLSTNHILSIWECDGKANISTNWKRKVLINHALIAHYANVDGATGETEQQFSERKQVSQRVRAFAWSPIAADSSRDGRHATSAHLLAVSTEAGDLVILRVRSPYDLLAVDSTEWHVEVMRSFKLDELVAEAQPEMSKEPHMDNFFKTDHSIADHIAWGPWQTAEDTTVCATLAFVARRKLYTFQIQTEFGHAPSQINVRRQTHVKRAILARNDLTGPLKFIPKTNLLAVFAADAVFCVDKSSLLEDSSLITSHHLDNRWDEVSGVAFTSNSAQLPDIHIVSHLSSSIAVTTVLSTPLNDSRMSTPPNWQAAITQSKETFSSQHGLDGHVQERTWGVASSPLGDYVAPAITLLPSDSIAHVIPSDRHTIVNITQEVPFENDHILHTSGGTNHIASEVILSRLQRYLEQRSESIELDDLVQMLSQNIDPVLAAGDLNTKSSLSPNSDTYSIARHLRAQVLDRPDMDKERNVTLARLALGLNSGGARISPQIIQRLISEVTKLDSHLYVGGELSERIRQTYNILHSKLNSSPQPIEARSNKNSTSETCRICKEPISLESVKWARCASGHQFSRCALTFLAIQEPGFSKHCGVCGVQLLNEWKVPALMPITRDSDVEMMDVTTESDGGIDDGDDRANEAQDEDWVQISHGKSSSSELPASLARVLFAAFDTCIYCGGKFIA